MALLVPVLMNGSEAVGWMEMERSKVRGLQMENFRGLLSIRKI